MFTGLVQAIGRVAEIGRGPDRFRLVVDAGDLGGRAALGDSVSVSGVCLTVAAIDGRRLAFDVVPETLAKTTLGQYRVETAVNLELALRAGEPIGGHFVQGHVDGVGRVTRVHQAGSDRRLTIEPHRGASHADSITALIVPKGSIAVDGVSLTVAAADSRSFDVALIPTTVERTTLGTLAVGDQVNLETDVISRTVVHWLAHQAGGGECDPSGGRGGAGAGG